MTCVMLFVAGLVITGALLPVGLKTMRNAGWVANNYRGISVPFPAGLIPVSVFILLGLTGSIWLGEPTVLQELSLYFVVVIIGLLDDVKGTSEIKGIKGHLEALGKGRLTTGIMKAFVGSIMSFLAAKTFGEQDATLLVINTLLIALFTNSINLLDLRPGRAIKTFLAVSALLIGRANSASMLLLFPLTGTFFAYLPWDLKARGMQGDTASNLLGFVLGLISVKTVDPAGKLLILICLVAIHIYAERFSITALIERNPLLRYLDNLGRSDC